MYALAKILQYRETEQGTDLVIHIPEKQLSYLFQEKFVNKAEIRFDDGRTISGEQRKKAYATIRDFSNYTGELPEPQKEMLKFYHRERTGAPYFSLSDCTMDTAREFINTILELALEWGIPLSEVGVERTDDISKYLYFCIKHKKCAICGKPGEIHHEDAIGMGNDRTKVDDREYRKICLCREHHTIAHQMGEPRFRQMYKVYGIVVKENEHEKQ